MSPTPRKRKASLFKASDRRKASERKGRRGIFVHNTDLLLHLICRQGPHVSRLKETSVFVSLGPKYYSNRWKTAC